MNELILSATNTPAKFSFKNAQLNKISEKIAEQSAAMNSVYNAAKEGAETVNKALAPLFGELMASKCYKDDGFKSVADYAEQTFGMSKSMAYMLARVGEAFYNTDAGGAKLARETLSTSKLAELTGTDKKVVGDAIKAGELSAETPLAVCRDFATAHKKPGKEKVLPMFNVFTMPDRNVFAGNVDKETMYEKVAASMVANGFTDSEAGVFFATVKFDGDKPGAAQHFVAYTDGGYGLKMFEYRPYVKPALKDKGKRPSIAEVLAQLTEEQRAQLIELANKIEKEDEDEET